jgi:hypothetical protein
MDWYYSHGNERQGPVTLDALRQMRAAGQLGDEDLVWRAGMGDWAPARTIAELGSPAGGIAATPAAMESHAPPPPQYAAPVGLQYSMPQMGAITFTPRAMDMLRATRPWVRLFSILIFLGAALMLLVAVIMIIGAVAVSTRAGAAGVAPLIMAVFFVAGALLYLMPAVYLSRYASKIAELDAMKREDVLEQAMEAQKSFWKFIGILTAIMICLQLLGVIASMVGGMAMRGL